MAQNTAQTLNFLNAAHGDDAFTLHQYFVQASTQADTDPAPLRMDLPAMAFTTSATEFVDTVNDRFGVLAASALANPPVVSDLALLTGTMGMNEEDTCEYFFKDVAPLLCPRRNGRNDCPPENLEMMGRLICATSPDDAADDASAESLFGAASVNPTWHALVPCTATQQFHMVPLVVALDTTPPGAVFNPTIHSQVLKFPADGEATLQRCTFKDVMHAVQAFGYKDLAQVELGFYQEMDTPKGPFTELPPLAAVRWAAIQAKEGKKAVRASPPRPALGTSHSVQQRAMLQQGSNSAQVDQILAQNIVSGSTLPMPGLAQSSVQDSAQQAAMEAMMSLRAGQHHTLSHSSSAPATASLPGPSPAPPPSPMDSQLGDVLRGIQEQLNELKAAKGSSVPTRLSPASSGSSGDLPLHSHHPVSSASGLSVGLKVNGAAYTKLFKALLDGTPALAADLFSKAGKKGRAGDLTSLLAEQLKDYEDGESTASDKICKLENDFWFAVTCLAKMYIEAGFSVSAMLDYSLWLQSLRDKHTWQSINKADNMFREEVLFNLADFKISANRNIPFCISTHAKLDLMTHYLVKITAQPARTPGTAAAHNKLPTVLNASGVQICRAHAEGNCKQRNCDRDHDSAEAVAYAKKHRPTVQRK